MEKLVVVVSMLSSMSTSLSVCVIVELDDKSITEQQHSGFQACNLHPPCLSLKFVSVVMVIVVVVGVRDDEQDGHCVRVGINKERSRSSRPYDVTYQIKQ